MKLILPDFESSDKDMRVLSCSSETLLLLKVNSCIGIILDKLNMTHLHSVQRRASCLPCFLIALSQWAC